MGARRNFSRGGKITDTLKSRQVFGAPYKKSTIFRRAEGANENLCVILRRFRLKYRVSSANAVEYFVGRQHMTSFFNFQGASAPLFAPPEDAHVRFTKNWASNENVWAKNHLVRETLFVPKCNFLVQNNTL